MVANYYLHASDVTFDLAGNSMEVHQETAEPWKVTLIHRSHGRLATVTAVQVPGRWGTTAVDEDRVASFHEKPRGDGAWVNGGFFVLSPRVGDYIDGDAATWEEEPVERLAQEGELRAYRHDGFWRAMDTVRDRHHLEELWGSGRAPWKTWE